MWARVYTPPTGTSQLTGTIYYMSLRGMVARQDIYWTWEEALDARNGQGEA